jgi:hypothetical protein
MLDIREQEIKKETPSGLAVGDGKPSAMMTVLEDRSRLFSLLAHEFGEQCGVPSAGSMSARSFLFTD